MLENIFPYKESAYIKKTRKMLEVQGDKKEKIDATIDIIYEKEKKEYKETLWQKTKGFIEIFLGLAMLYVAISTRNVQKDIGEFSNSIQLENASLNSVLIENSNIQLSLVKKQTTFQVLDTLNKNLYQKEYELLKIYLKDKSEIKEKYILQEYLNNFENVYMACHNGLITKADVRYSYQYLLGMICSNNEVLKVVTNGYGGLKKLCGIFFSDSKLAKDAKMETNECK